MNPQNFIATLGWTLVHFLWQGFVIVALLAAMLRLMRGAASHLRYLAGCASLVLMLVAPALTFNYVAAHYSTTAPANIEFADSSTRLHIAPITSRTRPNLVISPKAAVPTSSLAERLETIFPWLVLGWLLGVCALSCRLLGGWLQIERLKRSAAMALDQVWHDKLAELSRRLGVRQSVRLLQSALVEVPTVIGWLRPVILLPASCLAGLTTAQLESILAHELAHIRRHDYLVNLLQSVVETVLFYHPAVWWVSRRVREERENCCDDLAVEVCGDRVGYARALATLEELRLAPAPLALAASGSPLLPRIRRLVGRTPGNLSRPVWPLAGMMALVLMTLVAFGLRGNRVVADGNANVTTNAPAEWPLKPRDGTSNSAVPKSTNKAAASSQVLTNRGRQAILSKLKSIEVDSLQFDHMPLTEVIHKLSDIATAQDPEHIGLNFYLDMGPPHVGSRIDPTTGLPLPPLETDIKAVTINLNPPLKHVSLAEVLDAITKTADHPIKYKVLDYAVVFTLKDFNEVTLETRIFHVDSTAFESALEHYSSMPDVVPSPSVKNVLPTGNNAPSDVVYKPTEAGGKADTTNKFSPLAKQMRSFLGDAGIDVNANNPVNFVYNHRKGILLVRATAEELDRVDTALQKLLYVPPSDKPTPSVPANASPNATEPKTNTSAQLNLEVKFIEVDALRLSPADRERVLPLLNTLDFTKPALRPISSTTVSTNGSILQTNLMSVTEAITSQVNGLLSEEQFARTIDQLERMDGVDELTAPGVTTLSGRQAQVQAVDIDTFVTGVGYSQDSHGKAKYDFQTQKLPLGPVADLMPRISADGNTIEVTIVATVTEFLGYSDLSRSSKVSLEKPPLHPGVRIQPNFRLRQMKTTAVAHDRETIVLAGLEAERMTMTTNNVLGGLFHTTSPTKSRKILLVCITPTIINPDGSRVHPDTNAPPIVLSGKNAK